MTPRRWRGSVGGPESAQPKHESAEVFVLVPPSGCPPSVLSLTHYTRRV